MKVKKQIGKISVPSVVLPSRDRLRDEILAIKAELREKMVLWEGMGFEENSHEGEI